MRNVKKKLNHEKTTTPSNQLFTTRNVDIGDENAIESVHNIRFNAFGNDRI
jgi:hypothetical protein